MYISKEQLIALLDKGLFVREIALELKCSRSTINRLLSKYEIKSKFNENCNEQLNCIECSILFKANKKERRKFCSRTCSVTFNNKNKVHSEETKNKIKETLLSKNNKKSIKLKNCKNCNNTVALYKRLCDTCKTSYYKYYRPLSNFDFDIDEYKEMFDFSLVEKYGWYSPSNKGNNLNGISKDHLYSVRDGFINKIDINIIKHPANCCLMVHRDNNIKNYNSSITLDELLKRIEDWNNMV